MAQIYLKTVPANEKTCILGTREAVIQPFVAHEWVDLIVGFFLSICGDSDGPTDERDVITGLGETIGSTGVPQYAANRHWIGVKDEGQGFPSTGTTRFIGWTNSGLVTDISGSGVKTSDIGIGTTNADYWRSINVPLGGGENAFPTFDAFDGPHLLSPGTGLSRFQHFPQNFAGGHAAGYAVLSAFRLRRPDPSVPRNITVEVPAPNAGSGDLMFSNTPSQAVLLAQLQAWTSSVETLGPLNFSGVPSALFLYWPYFNSRLRIHAMGIVKVLAP